MPKSQKKKKKTSVKKKTKLSARRRKSGTVATLKTPPAGKKKGKRQPTVAESGYELGMEDFADIFEQRASIISIVKGLEEQVDTAFELKDVLETELDTTHKKLSEELVAHAKFEEQVKSLEAQTALADQLREDISFVEEERNKYANLLAEIQPQIETVSEERDSLAKKVASVEAHAKELRGERTSLEAEVMNLKDKVADIDRLRGEVDNLRRKLTGADNGMADLRIQLEEQEAANRELMETRTRLECEIKMANANHEATKNELEMVKNALNDIRSEATLASGRVRHRYFKPKKKK
jgi:chromosome segregation ATPase